MKSDNDILTLLEIEMDLSHKDHLGPDPFKLRVVQPVNPPATFAELVTKFSLNKIDHAATNIDLKDSPHDDEPPRRIFAIWLGSAFNDDITYCPEPDSISNVGYVGKDFEWVNSKKYRPRSDATSLMAFTRHKNPRHAIILYTDQTTQKTYEKDLANSAALRNMSSWCIQHNINLVSIYDVLNLTPEILNAILKRYYGQASDMLRVLILEKLFQGVYIDVDTSYSANDQIKLPTGLGINFFDRSKGSIANDPIIATKKSIVTLSQLAELQKKLYRLPLEKIIGENTSFTSTEAKFNYSTDYYQISEITFNRNLTISSTGPGAFAEFFLVKNADGTPVLKTNLADPMSIHVACMNTWIRGKFTAIKVETPLQIAERIITCILYDLQQEPRILRLQKYLPTLLRNNIFIPVMQFIVNHYPECLHNILYLQMGDMLSTDIENIYEVYLKEVKPIISNKEIFKKRIAVIFAYEYDEHFIFFHLNSYTTTIEQELKKLNYEALIRFLQDKLPTVMRMIVEMASSSDKLPPHENLSTSSLDTFSPLYAIASKEIQSFCEKVWAICCTQLLNYIQDEQYITQIAELIKFITIELGINAANEKLSKLTLDMITSYIKNMLDFENKLAYLINKQIPPIINILKCFNTLITTTNIQHAAIHTQESNLQVKNAPNQPEVHVTDEMTNHVNIKLLCEKIWEALCDETLYLQHRWGYKNKFNEEFTQENIEMPSIASLIISLGKNLNICNAYIKAMQYLIFQYFYYNNYVTCRSIILKYITQDLPMFINYIKEMSSALCQAEGLDQKTTEEMVANHLNTCCQKLWIDALESEIIYAFRDRELIDIDQSATTIALLAHQLKVNNIISSVRQVVVTLLTSPFKIEDLNYQNIMENAELILPNFPILINRLISRLRIFEIDRLTFIQEPSIKEWCYQPVWHAFCTQLITAVHDKKGTLTIEQLAKILIWYAKQFEFEDVIAQVKAVTDTLPTEQVNSELLRYLRDLTVSKGQVESIGFYLGNIKPHKVIEQNQQENTYAVRSVGI